MIPRVIGKSHNKNKYHKGLCNYQKGLGSKLFISSQWQTSHLDFCFPLSLTKINSNPWWKPSITHLHCLKKYNKKNNSSCSNSLSLWPSTKKKDKTILHLLLTQSNSLNLVSETLFYQVRLFRTTMISMSKKHHSFKGLLITFSKAVLCSSR